MLVYLIIYYKIQKINHYVKTKLLSEYNYGYYIQRL